MEPRHSRRFLFLSVISIVIITVAVVRFSAVQSLKVRSEISAYGVPTNESTGMAAVSLKRYSLPYLFEVGRVNPLTMNDLLLHTKVSPGLVVFGFESSEPVDCWVVLDDEPSWGFDRQFDAVLVNISSRYEFYKVLEITERCVVSFCFKANQDTLSKVTLMAVKNPWFMRHTDSDVTVNEAVDTARAFLELNEVDAGKYLSHTEEQDVPNYYWQKEFQYYNLANLVYHSLPESCDYVAVRFEQKHHPGHFYEVWVEIDSNEIIGGGTCR